MGLSSIPDHAFPWVLEVRHKTFDELAESGKWATFGVKLATALIQLTQASTRSAELGTALVTRSKELHKVGLRLKGRHILEETYGRFETERAINTNYDFRDLDNVNGTT